MIKEIIEVSIDGKNWKEWRGTLWEAIKLYPFVRERTACADDTSSFWLEVFK